MDCAKFLDDLFQRSRKGWGGKGGNLPIVPWRMDGEGFLRKPSSLPGGLFKRAGLIGSSCLPGFGLKGLVGVC